MGTKLTRKRFTTFNNWLVSKDVFPSGIKPVPYIECWLIDIAISQYL